MIILDLMLLLDCATAVIQEHLGRSTSTSLLWLWYKCTMDGFFVILVLDINHDC